jgi:serine/threonine-protein kinase RsbW
MAKRSFRLTIPSDLLAGRKVKERVLEAIAANKFSHHSTFAIHLAVEEALHNAIKHGNRLDPHKKVKIAVTVTPKRAEIVIEDEGVGFDRGGVPDPRVGENLEKCSGRGIFLIESYMDKVEWTHGGRRLRMIKNNEANGPHPS